MGNFSALRKHPVWRAKSACFLPRTYPKIYFPQSTVFGTPVNTEFNLTTAEYDVYIVLLLINVYYEVKRLYKIPLFPRQNDPYQPHITVNRNYNSTQCKHNINQNNTEVHNV